VLKKKYPLTTIAGVASIAVCVTLAAAAYAFYPWTFSPMTNWISDLGNTWLNPDGSIVFRLDMILVGLGLSAFFLGLRVLTHGQRIWTRLLVRLAQVGGLVSSLALVMTGVFSENDASAHALWASIMFIALSVTVMLLGWGVFFHPRVPTVISYYAFIVCAADVISVATRSHWLEWVAVPLLLVFVAQISYGAWRAAPRTASDTGPS
jgi:hypothetical protein